MTASNNVKIHPESSFFQEKRGCLPTPDEVREFNRKLGGFRATHFYHPPPVRFPSLGLLVKYGADVTISETRTQIWLRDHLQDQVPIPEVFGWAEHTGQRFIYMSLIEGETLQERWGTMNEVERRAVCDELSYMVKAWRALKQDWHGRYVGSFGKLPLNDFFLILHPELAGPFEGPDAVQRFQDACGINIDGGVPIVFTHDDLVPPNILLSAGPNPKVAAVIDWGQAGWYPAYWEYCQAKRVRLDPEWFSDELQEEWRTKYLPKIMDPVDDVTYYHPWLWFVLSMI